MPYPNGKQSRREQVDAWKAGGCRGPNPWPKPVTPEQKAQRAEVDRLERELKLGRWAPRVLSDSETAQRALVKRLRRAAVIQRGTQRVRSGPTQLEIANSWIARGRPADEPVPRLVQQQRAALARSNAKQAKLRHLARLARGTESQRQRGGRPDGPLSVEALARLTAWFIIWDACIVPVEFDDEPVRYGAPGWRAELVLMDQPVMQLVSPGD